MAGFFNSRSGAGVRNYYYYVPSDKKLHDIGLSSYTRNSLEKFGKRRGINGAEENDPDINEYLTNGIDSIKPILRGDSAILMLYRFDKATKRYLYTSSNGQGEDHIFWTPSGSTGNAAGNAFTNLLTFQNAFDLYQKGFINSTQASGYNVLYVWSKINNSLYGCINFNITGYNILNTQSSGVVSLFFQSKTDGNDRSVAFQPPMIAGIGKTATGREHAFGISESLDNGVLSQVDVGGIKNPNNTIAAPLKLHINRATGEWESGTTQVYCQVLDDIPGVPLKDLVNNVDEVSNDALNLPFQSGVGMVMMHEKGNPHLCVPCSYGCGPSEKERIPLVNRSPRAFTRGEIILASKIGPDWVPVPLNNGVSVAKRLTFEWSQIQKYVANAKSFFRTVNDTRFLERDIYADSIRSRFYESLNSSVIISGYSNDELLRLRQINIAKLTNEQYKLAANGMVDLSSINATISNLGYYPADGYLQFYDADVLPVQIGGNNTHPSGYLKNTIVSRTEPYDSDTGVAAQSVPCSWGMYFPDGYASLGVKKTMSAGSVAATPNSSVYSSGTLDFTPYTLVASQLFNLKDPYFYHLPAQIALNNNKSNQSLDINLLHNILKSQNANSSSPFCDQMIRYIQNPVKGHCLLTGSRPAYGLSPLNTTKVQFTPLSLESALSHTIIKDEGVGAISNPINGGYGDGGLKKQLAMVGLLRGQGSLGNGGFFGAGISRNGLNQYILELDSSVSGPISFGKNLLLSPQNAIFGPPQRGDKPDGGPGILPTNGDSENSNVIGIIAAKATFTLSQGGTIELKTDQRLGIFAYLFNTVGSSSPIVNTITNIVASINDNTGRSTQNRVQQWGGSLGAEQYKELGTTALWCAVYDHAPETIYDGRYFTPLQFNPSGKSVDFIEVSGSVGGIVSSGTEIKTITNMIRRNMLLTDPEGRGGFSYTRKIVGANPNGWVVVSGGSGYRDRDAVEFSLGTRNAKFIVSRLNSDTSIGEIMLNEEELGGDAYGETANNGTANPFKVPLEATFPGANSSAKIELRSGKVVEKLMTDKLQFYGIKKLTKDDNNGNGDGRGQVEGLKTTTFQLSKNSTGKYDIFFFFVSDIANYPEGGAAGGEGGAVVPQARYVNLEITSI